LRVAAVALVSPCVLASPLPGQDYWSIQVLSSKQAAALQAAYAQLGGLPDTRIERRGEQWVLRAGFWNTQQEAEKHLAATRAQFAGAFVRVAAYRPETMLEVPPIRDALNPVAVNDTPSITADSKSAGGVAEAESQKHVSASLPTEPVTSREGLAEDPAFQFSGYLKSLLINSSTADEADVPYWLSLNRARLKLNYAFSPALQVHVEHDTEVRAGNYLRSDAFQAEKSTPSRQYWHEGSVIADRNGYYASQRLFRAFAKLSVDAADLTVGRQRIPLGTGRMWSALDMLNPVNPLQIERDEYVGVDAALLEYKRGALSKLSLIYAPDPARRDDRWVGQYRTNLNGTDLVATYGKYWQDRIVGLDFATQVGDAGLHGELTSTMPNSGPNYRKLVLGMDYAFANTLTLSAEAYASSQTRQELLAQFAQNPQLAQVQPFGRRYGGFAASYEITPLLKLAAYWLFNLSEHGRFFSPTLTYSISDNLTFAGGAQFFAGSSDSDFGRGKNLGYLQLQYFF